MASVTQRVKQVQQPYGGYLPIRSFEKIAYDDGKELNSDENIHSSLIGLGVDYLTRFMMGDSASEAFKISLLGSNIIQKRSVANKLASQISSLDDLSIINACKLAGFDVCFRAGKSGYKPIEEIEPDQNTIENIRIMVERSIKFFEIYGPIVKDAPTFEGGYTNVVSAGDGDFMTKDTLWDFKVSSKAPTSKHSLQILMYYIMGQHSIHNEYKEIKYLGIFNPRLNIVYKYDVTQLPREIYEEVENNVIGYYVSGGNINDYGTNDEMVNYREEYTVKELCDNFGCKKNVIYKAIRSGELNAYKEGNKYFITSEDYAQYKERLRVRRLIICILSVILMILYFIFIINLFS